MKKVLIITAHFPPQISIAALRLRGLAKYLPDYGWEPIVLTPHLSEEPDPRFRTIQVKHPGNSMIWLKMKLGLNPKKRIQEHLGISASVRERKSLINKAERLIKSIFLFPSKHRSWCPYAIKSGGELLKAEKTDAIISSSGPVTTHLIAKELKKRFKVPWVADFRDLWTQNHFYRYGPIRKYIEREFEIKTIYEGDALVTVSTPLTEKLGSLHKDKKVYTITNGFDPEQIRESPLTTKLTITYTGRIYINKQNTSLIFQAVRELINEEIINHDDIKVEFFGPPLHKIQEQIKQYDLESTVHQHGLIPREDALSKQAQSQVLLL
ncbi:MAG: glycosyltransferase, partial [Planctomycetota bacterium]